MPGVHAVMTHEDVPGDKRYGLEFADQPVLAFDRVRYFGEPVALVAAEHPEQARRAAEKIVRRVRAARAGRRHGARDRPGADPPGALDARATASATTRGRTSSATCGSVHGDPGAAGDVSVEGYYELGIQDQAFLGPESGLAVPDGEGGVDIYVATQWLHVDRDQVAPCLGLRKEQVRIHLAGVGRRVRRARGPVDADPRRDARAAHEPAGEDRLHARGVVLRPRPPAPGADLDGAPRQPRRQARLRPGADPARRRRVRLELDGGDLERRARSPAGRTRSRTR